MGIREVQAYRAREYMTAREFIGFWLEEEPGADPFEVVSLLADLIDAERTCVHRRDFHPIDDFWLDEQAAARNELKDKALALFKSILADRNGIEETESIPLSRDALAKAFGKLEIPGPRFLYPPSPTGVPIPPPGPSHVAPATVHPRASELASGLCRHSEDFRTAVWYGESFRFSGRQAKAIEALWAEWEKGDLGLSQQTIGYIVDSASDRFQLRDIFRKHRAWGRMIQPAGGKGIFRLGPPPA